MMLSKKLLPVVVGLSLFAFSAHAEKQPHMRDAIKHLNDAKVQLEKASHDKGGHRVKAIALINQAITEVEAGEQYDNTHPEH